MKLNLTCTLRSMKTQPAIHQSQWSTQVCIKRNVRRTGTGDTSCYAHSQATHLHIAHSYLSQRSSYITWLLNIAGIDCGAGLSPRSIVTCCLWLIRTHTLEQCVKTANVFMFTEKEVKIALSTPQQHAHGWNSYAEYVVFTLLRWSWVAVLF